jgi:hypothetical protein
VNRLERAGQICGQMINISKPRVTSKNDSQCKMHVHNILFERDINFPYLGPVITDDIECTAEVTAKLTKAYGVCSSLKKLWCSHRISIETKIVYGKH